MDFSSGTGNLQTQKALLLTVCVCTLCSGAWLHYRANQPFAILREEVNTWLTPSPLLLPEPLPVHWSVNLTGDRQAGEAHHVVFVKVHKAASSTLSSLFIRFSISRQLNVMFPREGHILSEKSPVLRPLMDHPQSPPFVFDILCNHVVFHRNLTHSHLLPKDTVYICILRNPLNQVHSAYDYFRNTHFSEDYLMRFSNFTDFMSRQAEYEHHDPYYSFTNNRMALDLGLPVHQLHNTSYIPTFLKEVDDIFDLVLIAERFDESLILLKRRLNWTLKDMLYMSLNKRSEIATGPVKVDSPLEEKFKKFDQFDVALYKHFSERFDQLVRKEGPGFDEEVETFRVILQMVRKFCEIFTEQRHIRVPQSKWNDQFEIQSTECDALKLQETFIVVRAKYWQGVKMNSKVT